VARESVTPQEGGKDSFQDVEHVPVLHFFWVFLGIAEARCLIRLARQRQVETTENLGLISPLQRSPEGQSDRATIQRSLQGKKLRGRYSRVQAESRNDLVKKRKL
jgi:hypothetical protein